MNPTSSSTYHSYERPRSSEGLAIEARRQALYQSAQYMNAIAVHTDPGLWAEEPKPAPVVEQATASMAFQPSPVETNAGAAGNLAMNGAQSYPQTSSASSETREQQIASALRNVEDAHRSQGGMVY